MRFIAFDSAAAEDIVSDRFMQSVEYENGRTFAALLQDAVQDARLSPRITILRHEDGLFFLSASRRSPDCIVFDRETCGLFSEKYSPADVLLCIQKVLRFAMKTWRNLNLSATERVLPNSSKAIIFPYPISQHTSFRISVEMSPDDKRQARRANDGRSMLVYRSGTDEGGGPQEISSFQGYEQWLELLTEKQRSFVQAVLHAPHRIEGPAGTGKTLCLILKAITGLRAATLAKKEHSVLFVTHSEATRRTVEQLIATIDPWNYLEGKNELRLQTLKLATLQQLCGELLRREISETEFLDRDAMESKQLQVLYVDEALKATMNEDYPTHKKFLSVGFDKFLASTEHWAIAEMLQHEISVIIKGRADEQLENYRKLPRLKYGLPTETPADRGFVWRIFGRYQAQLQTAAQFDTDDIVLTTIGQLDTPIWRRRRDREGYDSIYIDETHLFNINELSLFHHLSKSVTQHPIAYSVDRSQAVGDRGWTDELFEETLSPDLESREKATRTEVHGIFRCSPDIINLAFSVTSAGATLFTNFDDPLKLASSMFTAEEERKCLPPRLVACTNDEDMVTQVFAHADQLTNQLEVSRSDVALVAFSDELFKKAQQFAEVHNKPVEQNSMLLF